MAAAQDVQLQDVKASHFLVLITSNMWHMPKVILVYMPLEVKEGGDHRILKGLCRQIGKKI